MNSKKIIASYVFLTVCVLSFVFYDVHAQEKTTQRLYLSISPHANLVIENRGGELLVNNYLSSTIIEIDKNGVGASTYYPDGNQVSGDIQSDKLFTGHRKLDNLSIYHAGARFYSPTVGQFIQPDKKEGPNRYAYVGNNPIAFVDRDGNSATSAVVSRIKEAIIHMLNRGDSQYQAIMESHHGLKPSQITATIRSINEIIPPQSKIEYYERTSKLRSVSDDDMQVWNTRLADDPEFSRLVSNRGSNLRPDTVLYRSQPSTYLGKDGMQSGNPDSSAQVYDFKNKAISARFEYERDKLNSTDAAFRERLAFLDKVQNEVREGTYFAYGLIDAKSLGPTLNMYASPVGMPTSELFGYGDWGHSLMRIDLMDVLRAGGDIYRDAQAGGSRSAFIFTIPEPVPYVEVAKIPTKK